MGRLVGLEYFFSEEAFAQEKTDAKDIRRARSSASEGDEDDEVQDCQRLIAQRIQQRFQGHMLRRTTGSLDWKQQPLINLPPYQEQAVVVKPTEREMSIISELADRVKERYAAVSLSGVE
jgi:TATA-binding protein-associated factor